MPHRSLVLLLLVVVLASCASEDPSILDPPPNSTAIRLRFMNMVPDATSRRLLLERGFQSTEIPPGGIAPTVSAPTDSSLVTILAGGTTEFASERRYSFVRNTIANVVAMGTGPADSAVVHTVILPLTGAAVSSVRVANMVPDTTLTYDVHLGCPSGRLLNTTSVSYGRTSLYADVTPGQAVLSLIERSALGERTLGLFECDLVAYRPYAIYIHRSRGMADPQVVLLDETDTSASAMRPLLPVTERVGEARLFNLASSAASARLTASGQTLATGVASQSVSAYVTVPTCVSLAADLFEVTVQDGRSTTDSTVFSVRRRSTIITCDSGAGIRSIVVPPSDGAIGAGRARIRVVHASALHAKLVMSVGGRSDAQARNGLTAGITLTRDLAFGEISGQIEINAGEVPLTVTTATTPTTMLHVTRTNVEAGRDYLLVIGHDGTSMRTWVLEDDAQATTVQPSEQAVFLRFVNGISGTVPATVTIGTVVQDDTVYYRNSVATSVAAGGAVVRANGAQRTVPTTVSERTLVIAAERNGTTDLLSVTSAPLTTLRGQSERRVVNATKDVAYVSVAYDSLPAQTPTAPMMAQRVGYGEVSPVERVTLERRGTFYVFDDDAKTELYTLPMNVVPLGNSGTFIVVGSRESGYDVIVLQEF